MTKNLQSFVHLVVFSLPRYCSEPLLTSFNISRKRENRYVFIFIRIV